MEPGEIFNRVKKHFPQGVLELKTGQGDPWIEVAPAASAEVSAFLKDNEDLLFDSLMCLSGVDYGQELAVVYHLFSMSKRHKIVLKVKLNRESPRVPTVEGVWPVAGFFEREAYDLFGIVFLGHSDLRRLLLPDDWEGHPLRKDYQYPANYQGIPI